MWLTALLPPFLLAFYKGWRGASVATAGHLVDHAFPQGTEERRTSPSIPILMFLS